ncbi:MAG: NAD(P)/FAD-dependent oxidoreductase [Egicoccus sp.]
MRRTRGSVPAPDEHVVVIGGGFGGLRLARALSTRAARRSSVRVTLVDRHNHHTFQPLLYQVATAGLQPQDIGISLRAVLRRRGVDLRMGEVVDVDPFRRTVHLADGGWLAYDRLVLAVGAIADDFGVPGVAEHAYGLKTLADATTLRNAVLRRFEAASAARATSGPSTPGLTFLVAGGGPTGVELAGALAELVDLVVRRDHPDLDLSTVRIVLVEPRDRLLGTFSVASGEHAREQLERRGVEVRLGVGVARAAADHVELTDGEIVATQTLVWAAGVAASPLAAVLGAPLTTGRRVAVDEHLRVVGCGDVYAIGDVAGFPLEGGGTLPQVAPVAMQQADHVARTILEGPPSQGFRYRDKGSMATIGRAAAVAELPGHIRLRGALGWLAWLTLHLLQLVGFKNRFGVLASWIWNYATVDHAARLILDQREAERVETGSGWVRRRWAA